MLEFPVTKLKLVTSKINQFTSAVSKAILYALLIMQNGEFSHLLSHFVNSPLRFGVFRLYRSNAVFSQKQSLVDFNIVCVAKFFASCSSILVLVMSYHELSIIHNKGAKVLIILNERDAQKVNA